MKCAATGSTAIGFLVLFWPELLPDDFDERDLSDLDELANCVDLLQADGKLIAFPDVSNGDYTAGIFVDEPPAEELLNYSTLLGKIDSLHAADEGWFGGLEAIYRVDRSYLDRHPRKCSAVHVPAGEYSAELFVTDVPDSVYEEWIERQAGGSAQRWWWMQTWFASLGIVAAMVCVVCLFAAAKEWTLATFAVSAVLLFIAWLMSLTPGYVRVQQARREYAATYPHFVVQLRSVRGA
jgi:hypothetical protein